MKKTKQHHFFLTIEREISNLYTTKRYQQRYLFYMSPPMMVW